MKKDVKEEFIEQALRYIEGIKKGPLSKSHAAHKKLMKIFKILVDSEDRGHLILSQLITHDEPAVRLAAATYLYPTDPERSIAEFQSLDALEISHISALASSNLWRIHRGLFHTEIK